MIATPPRLWICSASGEVRPTGARVTPGEVISAPEGGKAAAIAPTFGILVGADRCQPLGGAESQAVLLETAGTDEALDEPDSSVQLVRALLASLQPGSEAVAKRLATAGVSADRWTSPDLLAQLVASAQSPVQSVLCNAIDLDPVLPLQRTVATARGMDLMAGVAGLARMVGAAQAVVALPEDTESKAVAALRKQAEGTIVRLWAVRAEYPIAHPSLLIRKLLGRRLAPGQLPTQAGVLLLDAAAAVAVGRYLLHQEPMLRLPLGIYDQQHGRAHLVRAPVGTRLVDLLKALGISADFCETRAGHSLRDMPVGPQTVTAAGELTAFVIPHRPSTSPAACLRCGWCVDACPVRIHPAGLLEAAQERDPELARQYGLDSCIECGICNYVCPSRLPLLQGIREIRATQ